MVSAKKAPSVGVVCSTYRNPDQNSLVRLYGVVSLFDQMMHQNYDGDIKIALVDDSPEPHPFYQEIVKSFPDRVVYIHVPSRNGVANDLKSEFPKALGFMPDNETLRMAYTKDVMERARDGKAIRAPELKILQGDFNLSKDEWDEIIGRKPGAVVKPKDLEKLSLSFNDAAFSDPHVCFWHDRLRQVRGYARFMPFDRDYPIQPNIFLQIFNDRPTIGMKKNIGVQALAEKFGAYDAIVFCDDDDHHSPDYVRHSVEALGDNDFTRMTRYITHVHHADVQKRQWGVFDLQIEKDFNGYWVLPAEEEDREFKMYSAKEGILTSKLGDKFSRPVTVAWPILSHEGALHTYSYRIWEKSVPKCGGAIPVSFAEDLFFYRELKNHFGPEFKDTKTDVQPGREDFIRITDGTNASLVEWTEDVAQTALPAWCSDAVRMLTTTSCAAVRDHWGLVSSLARTYTEKGKLDFAAGYCNVTSATVAVGPTKPLTP